jgi:hypothetical protein
VVDRLSKTFSTLGLLFIAHMGGKAPNSGVAVLLMPPPFILIVNDGIVKFLGLN